jgi:BirA family biotin operon repressor/biotin-[acetyl-CoA-carboxylase] ligase
MESIIHLAETESTNNYLIALLKKEQLDEGTIVIADYQKAGKGQGEIRGNQNRAKTLPAALFYTPFLLKLVHSSLFLN